MSFIPALVYTIGIGVFSFVGWILSGILDEFKLSAFSQTGSVYTLFNYAWVGLFILYLVFGGWWVVRQYNENQYMGGLQ